MCSTFAPGCRYDTSNFPHFGKVYCPNTVCSDFILCIKGFFNLSAEATINVLNVSPRVRCAISLLKSKQLFFLKFGQVIYIFGEIQKLIQDFIRDSYCPICPKGKNLHLSSNKISSFYDCNSSKACFRVLNIPLGIKS